MIRWSSWGSVLPVLVSVWPTLVKHWHSHDVGALLGVGQPFVGNEISQRIGIARVGDLAGVWAGVAGAYMNRATAPLAAFWEAQHADCPILAPLAISRLSAPVSTASVERQLSNARLILSDRGGGRLSDKTLEDLMMISGNRKLAEEVRLARRSLP